MSAWRWWLIGEAILAYALPAYFWLWGLITLPMWILGTTTGDATAIWYTASVFAGILGVSGVTFVLKQVISQRRPTKAAFICCTLLCSCGVFAIWAVMTGHFHSFELNWFTLLSIVAPTICTVHFLALFAQLLRNEGHGEPPSD
jgi:hypothetical protein